MSLSTFNFEQAAVSQQRAVKVVVLCERVGEGAIEHLKSLSSLPALELHVVEVGAFESRRNVKCRLLRCSRVVKRGAEHLELAKSPSRQLLWEKCAPGTAVERVARYSARIEASLVIVLARSASDARRWWRRSFV